MFMLLTFSASGDCAINQGLDRELDKKCFLLQDFNIFNIFPFSSDNIVLIIFIANISQTYLHNRVHVCHHDQSYMCAHKFYEAMDHFGFNQLGFHLLDFVNINNGGEPVV